MGQNITSRTPANVRNSDVSSFGLPGSFDLMFLDSFSTTPWQACVDGNSGSEVPWRQGELCIRPVEILRLSQLTGHYVSRINHAVHCRHGPLAHRH